MHISKMRQLPPSMDFRDRFRTPGSSPARETHPHRFEKTDALLNLQSLTPPPIAIKSSEDDAEHAHLFFILIVIIDERWMHRGKRPGHEPFPQR